MADKFTKAQRSQCMSRIKSRDTKPEIKVRRFLFGRGYRYRVNVKSMPGSPDIVLPKYRTVIFINGCFWHGHKGCKHYTIPATNTEFWQTKVERNKERDLICSQHLEALNWSVVTIWECELKNSAFDSTMDNLLVALEQNRNNWEAYQQKRKNEKAFDLAERKRKKIAREKIEQELQDKFNIPKSVFKISRKVCEE